MRPENGVVEEAAAEVRARIEREQTGQPWELRTALGCVAQRFCDQEFNAGNLSRLCGVGEKELQRLFKERLGRKPWDYIRNCRMEVAATLLRDTDLEIWRIARAVGYASATSFANAFGQWSGRPPSAYRRKHRDAAPGKPMLLHDPDFLRKLNRGEAEPWKAEVAIRYLEQLYGLGPASAPGFESPDPAFYDEVLAEVVWRRLRQLPRDERQEAVRRQYGLRSPALFQLLLDQSREQADRDPRRSGELAELALASLDAVAETEGVNLADLRSRAWAWVGNARRLGLDFPGAEAAFDQAETIRTLPRKDPDPLVGAEIHHLKAMLRDFERRFDEALDLNRRALDLLRQRGPTELLARALIAGSSVHLHRGRPDLSVPLLREALAALADVHRPRLRLTATCELVTSSVRAGLLREAGAFLPEAQALAAAAHRRSLTAELKWAEAAVRRAEGWVERAEELLLEAQDDFARWHEKGQLAVVSLALAELCADQGREVEALRHAVRTMPLFEALPGEEQAVVALDLVRGALAEGALPEENLARIGQCLEELRRDPLLDHKVRQGGE